MLWDYDTTDLEVKVAELLVATTDKADPLVDGSVQQVLQLIRERLGMDVVFVSEFSNGRRVLKKLSQAPGKEVLKEGDSDLLEASWCQRVVDGRLPEFIRDAQTLQAEGTAPQTPFPIGTHMSTPIVLDGGEVYGTLCCFSFNINDKVNHTDMKKLRYTAQLTADRLSQTKR